MEELKQHKEYDNEPVEYCVHCLSLAIRDIGNQPYCDKCGSCNTAKTDIHSWETMYGQRYGGSYVTKK